MSINSTYNAKLTGSYKSSAQVVIYTENRIDENLKPIEESMNFKISFMPQRKSTSEFQLFILFERNGQK
ncbi:unnamed protein product [Rhizophagus irregularis]|nr:unnamed protein product [Rhizophagus irregularis]